MIEQAPPASSPLVPRDAFPLLTAHDIAYLDSAASAQKPKVVLDRMRQFYGTSYANIHRAVYPLSEAATEAYESARARVARFLKAPSADSVVFTRNATEAVNLVAHSFGSRLKSGDRILVTTLEHHANIVPWQLLCDRQGLELLPAPIDANGDLVLDALDRLLERKPKLVAVTAASNALPSYSRVNLKRVTTAPCLSEWRSRAASPRRSWRACRRASPGSAAVPPRRKR